ncbi:alpha/beta fold hydrolase [Catellatospora bangladeshensis]|uniref:Alpha/beta hydrolase n=1 Tax=Catellatospora bangladeshensis TaxID=310355 RepID=A0A8J3JPN1_9ACTN|nr:alpha/beta fold hydrolase [Catellatospora bangladeshensis]GIF84592.1 alpha/beta hydrolase [Catellatospora bangladeshensis]
MKRLTYVVLAAVVAVAVGAGAPASAARPGLRWAACPGAADPGLQCTTVKVPLDYHQPGGRSIDIAVSRLPATDPAQRRGVLLTTGGGPGGPGVQLPEELAAVLPPQVRARYDLIGFDIRFAEQSTPISCGQPGEEPGGFWVRDPAGLRSFIAQVSEARRYAQACAAASGWALPHATTANAARDMDEIRKALGEAKISYLGGSYAGMLGATYSTLFPDRVDRFVLDSPVNGDAAWRQFELSRTPAFETGLAAFAAWIADNGGYGFGNNATEVAANIEALLDLAAAAPIEAGGHAWTAGELGSLVIVGIFFEQYFPYVAADLAAVRDGSPPPVPMPLYPSARPGVPGVPADNHTAVNTAYRCGDNAWPRSTHTYLVDVYRYAAQYPAFGPANANINACAFWPSAADNRVPLAGNRAPGVLVTAALRDVSVPIANSRAVAAAIHGSRLITIDAQTHAPFPHFGNACLNAAVVDYLVTGQLPADDVAC